MVFLATALALALAGSPPPARVAVATRSTLGSCELAPALSASLARWLPGIVIVGADQSADLQLEVAQDQADLQVVLRSPSGAIELSRSLPASGTCAADADGIALVVERYLRDLGWEPGAAPLPITEQATPTPTPAGTATAAAPVPRTSTLAAITPPPSIEIALGVVGGLTLPETQPLRAAGTLGVAVRVGIGPILELLIEGHFVPPWSVPVARSDGLSIGSLSRSSWRVLSGAGGCLRLGPGRGCAGVRGGIEVILASASGELIFQKVSASVARPTLLAELRYDLEISRQIGLIAATDLLVRLAAPPLTVVDASNTYTPSGVAPSFRLGVWVRFL